MRECRKASGDCCSPHPHVVMTTASHVCSMNTHPQQSASQAGSVCRQIWSSSTPAVALAASCRPSTTAHWIQLSVGGLSGSWRRTTLGSQSAAHGAPLTVVTLRCRCSPILLALLSPSAVAVLTICCRCSHPLLSMLSQPALTALILSLLSHRRVVQWVQQDGSHRTAPPHFCTSSRMQL